MKSIADELLQHEFFAGMKEEQLRLLAGCGRNQVFASDTVIASEGSDANAFYVLRRGRVALRLHAPHAGPIIVQTLEAGEVLGWSWLFEPYRWSMEAYAVEEVHAICLDASCLRRKCDDDAALGYELLKRFSRVVTQRLETTRMQLLNLYDRASSQ